MLLLSVQLHDVTLVQIDHNLDVLVDKNSKLIRAVKGLGLPTTVLFDPDGKEIEVKFKMINNPYLQKILLEILECNQ